MRFGISNAKLANTDISLDIKSDFPSNATESSALKPQVAIDKLLFENVRVHYTSIPDGLFADIDVGQLHADVPTIDLNASVYEVNELSLTGSHFSVRQNSNSNNSNQTESPTPRTDTSLTFSWPDMQVLIQNVHLENNSFDFVVDDTETKSGIFDPNSIHLTNIFLSSNKFAFKEQEVSLELDAFRFKESSGLDLKEFAFELKLNDKSLSLSDLAFSLNNSDISGQLGANFPSVQKLIEDPSHMHIDQLRIETVLDITDAFLLEPSLREIAELQTLSKKKVSGLVEVSGKLNALNFNNSNIGWGNSTLLSLNGMIYQATNPNQISYSLSNVQAKSTRADLIRFVNEDSLGIRLPDRFSSLLQVEGDRSMAKGVIQIRSSQGDIHLKGKFNMNERISFDGHASIDRYLVGQLLNDPRMGALSMSISTNGRGTDLNSLDAELNSIVTEWKFNNYLIQNLQLQGSMKEGIGKIESYYKDTNLHAELKGNARIDSIASEYRLELNIIGADLQALGLTPEAIRTKFKLNAELKGDTEAFDFTTSIEQGTVVRGNDAFNLGTTNLTTHVRPDTSSVQMTNDLIDFDLRSNANLLSLGPVIERHLRRYLKRDSLPLDTINIPVKLLLKAHVNDAAILSDVFMGQLQELDTILINVEFDEESANLKANISVPHVLYNNQQMDSLIFDIYTNEEELLFNMSFTDLLSGPLHMKTTSFSGKGINNQLQLTFLSFDEKEKLIEINSELSEQDDQIRFHILPEQLILNKEKWTIGIDNEIIYKNKKVGFNDFILSLNDRSVELTDQVAGVEKEHIAIQFQHFEISDLLSYFNPDEQLASGRLEGDLIIQDPFRSAGLLADLTITQLQVIDVDMGNLKLAASSEKPDHYDLGLTINEGMIDLDLNGNFKVSESGPEIDLTLDLQRLDLFPLEKFASMYLTKTSGQLNGQFKVQGTLQEPKYNGQLFFDRAAFTAKKINSSFTIPAEEVLINERGMTLNNFKLVDANGNHFTLSGQIMTPSISDPKFDLIIKAKEFQVLNATKENNDFLYGVAAFDADGTLKGDLLVPKLDITFKIDPSTDITYLIPNATLELESRDDVVLFVNKAEPDAILTRKEEVGVILSGLDVKANIKIEKEANVKVIIDQETGDNFQVAGRGDLKFSISPNGQMKLTGIYEVSSGSYEMNLYNIVNRRFELSPTSKVSWSGDPFDAKLDIRTIYSQEASCLPLMASVTSGLDESSKMKFRQALPFFVYLDVQGYLDAPELSFALDMPKDQQGAIGGQVYNRVQQVNKNEEELNKQVFSLLVLNRFYPESGSDGSTGGVASVARNNINDALSDQLNIFSDKLLGQTGVQLDFGLDSYTDYQGSSATEKTQLDVAAKKSLFNERLILSVGSEVDVQGGNETDESPPLIGKVSIEYMLTPDGVYRLKGFRRNDYENVIDGQSIVSGVALNFNREFNQFDEFWRALFRKDKDNKNNLTN